MVQELFQLAFIGPGGPEVLVVMLVLLLMFGAKDAPRIFRKLNEIINQIRNSADGFKREVLYGDPATDSVSDEDYDSGHDEDYDSGHDEDHDSGHDEDHDYSEELEEPEPEPETSSDEDGDAGKA